MIQIPTGPFHTIKVLVKETADIDSFIYAFHAFFFFFLISAKMF